MLLKKRLRYARDFWLTLRKYRLSPRTALSDFYRMSVGELFSPLEILRLGLLNAASPLAGMSRTTSKEALLRTQTRLNPSSHFHLTEDKLDFFEACEKDGLPTPRLHAIYSRTRRTVAGVQTLTSTKDLADFLAGCAHSDLVLKPADGTHGEGVLVLSRLQDGRWDTGAEAMSALDIDRFIARSPFADWLFQQRLSGSEALRRLSGTDLLQTARVVTLVNEDGRCEILLAWLRIVAGHTVYDNFNFGAAGNIVAPIDLESGRVGAAAKGSEDRLGLDAVTEHPRTGHPITGISVPYWSEVLSLTKRAGECFAPLRTVGWDVAITDEGPLLVEGNVTWDPLPANPDLRTAVEKLQAALDGTKAAKRSSLSSAAQ